MLAGKQLTVADKPSAQMFSQWARNNEGMYLTVIKLDVKEQEQRVRRMAPMATAIIISATIIR